jgi:ribonuclease HII
MNISELFKNKYEALYTSVKYDKNEMKHILEATEYNIANCCNKNKCYSAHKVSGETVKKAVKELKHNKKDGFNNYTSDHIYHATDTFYLFFSYLCNMMITHGVAPNAFCKSTLVPIPKDARKSLNDSSNYRSIAMSSILAKLFDNIILCEHRHKLDSCELQFGFKQKHSTMQCTYVLQEIINHYNKNGSHVFVMMLDCSKAFDRVQYNKLFRILINKNLCPYVCRLLV